MCLYHYFYFVCSHDARELPALLVFVDPPKAALSSVSKSRSACQRSSRFHPQAQHNKITVSTVTCRDHISNIFMQLCLSDSGDRSTSAATKAPSFILIHLTGMFRLCQLSLFFLGGHLDG